MKTLKTLFAATALSLFLLLSGCALLDGFMGVKEVPVLDDEGLPLYKTADGLQTTDPVDPATGKPNEPMKKFVPADGAPAAAAKDWLSLLGPWGALAGTVVAAAAGVYVRVRTGQSNTAIESAEAASRFLIVLIEKIKTGVADVFTDGKLDSEKLRAWLKDQGQQFSDPAYLDEMVQKVTKGL